MRVDYSVQVLGGSFFPERLTASSLLAAEVRSVQRQSWPGIQTQSNASRQKPSFFVQSDSEAVLELGKSRTIYVRSHGCFENLGAWGLSVLGSEPQLPIVPPMGEVLVSVAKHLEELHPCWEYMVSLGNQGCLAWADS